MTLTPFFSPRGVAVIGASTNPTKLGYGLARNLLYSNYPGVVHLINPKGGMLMGHRLLPSIAEAPDPVDMAVLLIPAGETPAALAACGQRGIRAVILGSGGFRETGPEGAALEDACLETARRYGMRLIGPNCIGLLDTHLPIDATFLPPPGPMAGEVAFLSHSGAICAAVIDWARGNSFGLSRLVSLGNQVDVCETEMLELTAADPFTRVLTLYLEGVRDGREFVHAAGRVAQEKPIIALKVGRFAGGQRAAASHTGALAGAESAYAAAFRRCGVLRAETSEEMFDWARALAWCPPLNGPHVAVLTNAGGPGVTAADALELNGLRLAELSAFSVTALAEVLPPAASLHNPVDMLASASPEQYAAGLRILLADPLVDAAMVICPPPPMYTAGAVAKAIIPVTAAANKPVVVALMGERLIQEAVEHLRAGRVPEYRFPERAASALGALYRRAQFQGRNLTSLLPISPEQMAAARAVLQAYLASNPASEDGFLPTEIAARLLKVVGIAAPVPHLAATARQAAQLARQMGFPVAVKVASPDILHKSDVDGVRLGIDRPEAAAAAFVTVTANAAARQPQARLLGAHIQPMLPAGQEVIVGALYDAQFGPLVMFGSGGVEVDGLKDVAFALAPLTPADMDHLLQSTWAGRRLAGFRHLPPADRAAVIDVLARLAQLSAELPQLAEVEINPLRVLEQGAVALDVRARIV